MDSSDANIQLGFAGFLLALGEKDRGLGILERLREQQDSKRVKRLFQAVTPQSAHSCRME